MDTPFHPAASISEASARVFSLARTTDVGTRGPKRALLALAASLGVDIDLSATNAVVGAQVAEELRTNWRPGTDFLGQQVTLTGMNHLLEAATRALWRQVTSWTIDEDSVQRVLLALPSFRPAKSKLEAVNRISGLTKSGSETLGPGGKEHKTVLTNLAAGVAPDLDSTLTKHALAEALCEKFEVPWVRQGGSTGQTITLGGLNLVLAGAERYLARDSASWATPTDEAQELIRVLVSGLEPMWDGRETVTRMRDEGSTNWRQREWQGFFFEEQLQWLLNDAHPTPTLGGPTRRYGNTSFDYATTERVWDAKAHTSLALVLPGGRPTPTSDSVLLNDSSAVTACIGEQGLGFLILVGGATYDSTGCFDEWHRSITREGKPDTPFRSNTGTRRRRKAGFRVLGLRALWISDLVALQAGISGGWMRQRTQGRQAPRGDAAAGAPRADKFSLALGAATPWEIASTALPDRGPFLGDVPD